MTNNSATGGYLPLTFAAAGAQSCQQLSAPASTSGDCATSLSECPGKMEDETLERFFQGFFAALSGLPGEMVRPRWLFDTGTQPKPGASWISFGTTGIALLGAPEFRHSGAGDGQDVIVSQEELTVLVSVVGPDCLHRAAFLRDGLYVPQNREQLKPMGMVFAGCGNIVAAPFVRGEHWIFMVNVNVSFRREVKRTAPVLNLLCCGSPGSFIESDTGVTTPLTPCGSK